MTKRPQKIIVKEKGQEVKEVDLSEKEQLSTLKKFQKISLAGQLVLYEHDLQAKKMDDIEFKKEVFCRWYVLPREEREPPGMTEFCQALGISHQTPYGWLEDSQVQSSMEQYRREYMRRFTSEILGHLKRRIEQFGRAQDVKLWLEYIEGWIPKEQQIQDQQINVIFRGIERPKAEQIAQDRVLEGVKKGSRPPLTVLNGVKGKPPDPSQSPQIVASEPPVPIPSQTTPDKKQK